MESTQKRNILQSTINFEREGPEIKTVYENTLQS
jgi:hypothetical protein